MCSRLSVLCPLCHGHNALPSGFLSSHFYRTDNGKKQSHSWLPPLSAFPKSKNWKQLHSSPPSPADKVCVAYAIYSQPSPPSPQMEQAASEVCRASLFSVRATKHLLLLPPMAERGNCCRNLELPNCSHRCLGGLGGWEAAQVTEGL